MTVNARNASSSVPFGAFGSSATPPNTSRGFLFKLKLEYRSVSSCQRPDGWRQGPGARYDSTAPDVVFRWPAGGGWDRPSGSW
jgi:hypothetical protein